MRPRSRQSFRLRTFIPSPFQFPRRLLHRISRDFGNPAVAEMDNAVGHAGDIGVMVMIAVAVPSSRLIRSRASRTTIPVWESSAPVGSSQSSTRDSLKWRGRLPRAAARRRKAGRENGRGGRSARPERGPLPAPGGALRSPSRPPRSPRRQAGDQVVELKDEPHMEPAIFGQLFSSALVRFFPGRIPCRRCRVQAAEDVQQRRFAAPGGSQKHDQLADREVQVNPSQAWTSISPMA